MDIELGQILSQIVAFLIMFWILKRFAWQPLTKFMEDRRKLIQDEHDNIDNQKNEVKRLAEKYKEMIAGVEAEARLKNQEEIAKGAKIAQELRADAQRQAQLIIKNAQEEMQTELIKAKSDLKKTIVDLVINTTQKVLQEQASDENKQKALIEKILTQTEAK